MKKIFCYMQKPCYRTIKVAKKIWRLPFPYLVFKVFLSDHPELWVGAMNKPPRASTKIGSIPLSNIEDGIAVCLGDRFIYEWEDKINHNPIDVVSAFWNIPFECDFSYSHVPKEIRGRDAYAINFKKWSKLTLEEIVKIEWADIDYFNTLGTFKNKCRLIDLHGRKIQ